MAAVYINFLAWETAAVRIVVLYQMSSGSRVHNHVHTDIDWQRINTRLPDGSQCIEIVIYTAAVQEAHPNWL